MRTRINGRYTKGKLVLHTGPMFSGKTSAIVKAKRHNPDALVFKPAFDTRRGFKRLETHDGETCEALEVSDVTHLDKAFSVGTVLFDEVQFMTAPMFTGDFVSLVERLLENRQTVICAGLDLDAFGQWFDITARIMVMADESWTHHGVCAVCGDASTMTMKTGGDTHERVELGGSDKYVPVCAGCWRAPG